MTKPDAPPLATAIDCHAHVFLASLPVAAGSRYRPHADAALATYAALLDAHGMAGGVLVQVSFLGTDNSYLTQALAAHPARLRGIAVVAPEASIADLTDLRRAGVVGVRWNLIGRPLPDLGSALWRGHLAALREAGLHLEIQSEGAAWATLLPTAIESGVTVVIDHFGRPSHENPDDAGLAAVLRQVRHPSVWVKLSAPYRFAADAGRCAALIANAAGTERLVWGSDWPWTQHPEITDYAGLKANPARWLGDAAAHAILIDNPRRLYWR